MANRDGDAIDQAGTPEGARHAATGGDVIVFLGPSLPVTDARALLHASYRPPAAQGDVLRATLEHPRAIGIIDGYFERLPAVWHKEILWAMSQGVHVFGAASMGALRAAELCAFGMVGIGVIFEQFRTGVLEADDEVAVAHADQHHGYRVLSEAFVNIRATLAAAEAQGVIEGATRQALIVAAKERFYSDRSFATLLSDGAIRGVGRDELGRLRDFLPRGRVNQKRLDSEAMLRAIAAQAPPGVTPKSVEYVFEITDAWVAARRDVDGGRPPDTAHSDAG
jgi:hypothetical protein